MLRPSNLSESSACRSSASRCSPSLADTEPCSNPPPGDKCCRSTPGKRDRTSREPKKAARHLAQCVKRSLRPGGRRKKLLSWSKSTRRPTRCWLFSPYGSASTPQAVLLAEPKPVYDADLIMCHQWTSATGASNAVDAKRHDGKANYLLADSHVETLFITSTFNPAKGINLWNPGLARRYPASF